MVKTKKKLQKVLHEEVMNKTLDDEAKTTSPVPPKKIVMLNFSDAIREVLNGGHLTRVSWSNIKTYIFLEGDYLKIQLDGKKEADNLIVSIGDMEGLDWYTIPQVN